MLYDRGDIMEPYMVPCFFTKLKNECCRQNMKNGFEHKSYTQKNYKFYKHIKLIIYKFSMILVVEQFSSSYVGFEGNDW